MKERNTFVYDEGYTFDPQQFQLKNDSLRIQSLEAAREIRLTFDLYDLPQEVACSLALRLRYLY